MPSPNLVSKTRQILSKLWTRKETVRRHTARADSWAKAMDLLSLLLMLRELADSGNAPRNY